MIFDGGPTTGTPGRPRMSDRRPQIGPSYGIEINRHTVEFSRNRRPDHPHRNHVPAGSDPALPDTAED